MLKKLVKYDLEFVYKGLVIFYILSLFFAILTRIFFQIDNSFIINIIAKVCSGITISMMFNILINNLMRLWTRFKNNFYGDESYLTHTLPVSKKELYLSKAISSLVTLFISIIVIGLTLFIAYYSKENMEILKGILFPIASMYDSTIMSLLLSILFLLFLEFSNILQIGYTGLILGYKMNNNKVLLSVLFGFVIYMVTQIINVLCVFVFGLFNENIMNLFYTNEIVDIGIFKYVIYLSIIIYSIILIVGYLINLKVFSKGVNVE